MKKINEILEKHTKIFLSIIFIVGIILYGILASKMTNAMLLVNDEELYVNIARSFFFEHNFSRGYELINYSCVLYSIVISLAYFFYSPESITFLMRMIGIILVVSSVFPAYLLSKEVLKSKTKALGIAAITIIIPEMMSGMYLVQENLSYPLFLWLSYFIYLKLKRDNEKTNKIDIAIIILFALLFFTKSYTIVFPIGYFLFLIIEEIKENRYQRIKQIIFQGAILGILILLGLFAINAINGFQEGTNHYESQILSVFPIDINKIGYFIYGIFCYIVFSMYSMGILPVMLPLTRLKYYDSEDKKFIKIITLQAILAVIEVSAIVFIPEEGGKLFPSKVCFRYLAIFFIPYLLMFLKCKKEQMKITKVTIIAYLIIGIYLLMFYNMAKERVMCVIDGYFLLLIDLLDSMFKISSSILMAIFIVITIVLIDNSKHKKGYNLASAYIEILVIALMAIFPINAYVPIYSSNVTREGLKTENDYIEIAKFLKLDYDKVYGYYLSDYNFFTQVISDYIKVKELKELEIDTTNQDVAIIVNSNFKGKIYGAEKADIDTEYFDVYINDEESTSMKVVPDN